MPIQIAVLEEYRKLGWFNQPQSSSHLFLSWFTQTVSLLKLQIRKLELFYNSCC